MRLFFCVIGVIYCSFNSLTLNMGAESVMHHLNAAQYSLMAVIFLCCFFILQTLSKNNKPQEETEKKKEETE